MNRRDFLNVAGAATIAGGRLLSANQTALAADTSLRRVRVGFIGTAHPHAQGKLAALRELSDTFDLVGVVEPNAALREACKSIPDYQGVSWIDEEALFATNGLQAVLVETDFHDLMPTAARCIARGLHVHLDKPPGKSLKELEKLLADARDQKVHVQMGYMLRYNPAFELCFRAAREGWLGRIFELNTTMSTVRDHERRKELGEAKGGAMFDLGSHIIDALVTVLGPPQKVTPFGRSLYPDQDSVVDNQLAVFEYPEAIATVRATFVEPNAGDRRQFVVCGENGTLEIRPLEPPKVQLTLLKPAGGYEAGRHDIEFPTMPGRYNVQLLDFAAVTRGAAKPNWTDGHDLAVQRALLQASGLEESA